MHGPENQRKTRLWTAASLCLILAVTGSSALYAEERRHQSDVAELETEASRLVSETAETAEKRRRLEKAGRISFDSVMADPDNVRLNFQFARQQVQEDNLLGAAATLERILMVNPGLHKIRLYYAIVLFRLDNAIEARRELKALLELDLPGDAKTEIKGYLKEIDRRARKTRFSISQSVGWGYDDNRNAAPSSKRRLLSEVPIGLTGNNRKTHDTNFVNITQTDITHNIGRHQLIANFTYYLQEQTYLDNLDLSSLQYELGSVFRTRWFNLTGTFLASHVFLSRESFLRTQGANFMIDRNIGKRLSVYSQMRYQHLEFLPITENLTARQRKGWQIEVANGFSYALTRNMRFSSSFIYANKHAKADFNGFERIVWRSGLTYLFPKGIFALNSLDLTREVYDEPDTAIAPRFRRDNTLRYRATLGAPLETLVIGKILPGPFRDITCSFSYEYYRALSNITNFTYTNSKISLMLSKKLEF